MQVQVVDTKTTVFVAHPDELIAMDHNTNLLNFYKRKGGVYEFVGDSFTKQNPCRECHTYGELIMKELPDPWTNWLPSVFSSITPEMREILGKDPNGNPRLPFGGKSMESIVRKFSAPILKSYSEKIMAQQEPFTNITVKEVVKPLFCDSGVTLEKVGDFFNSGRSQLFDPPVALRSLAIDFEINQPDLPDGSQYATEHGLDIPGAFGLMIGKSFGEDRLISHQTVINKPLGVAASMVDFPNGIFSKKRCGIWKHIPETRFGDANSGGALNAHLIETMAGNTNADVQEFLGYLKRSGANLAELEGEFKTRYGKFLDKCRDANSAIRKIEKVYPLYRARVIPYLQAAKPLKFFEKQSIVEHFPDRANSPSRNFAEAQKIIDGVYSEQEGLGLTEECQLNMEL